MTNFPLRLFLLAALYLPLAGRAQQVPAVLNPISLDTGFQLLAKGDYRGAFEIFISSHGAAPYYFLQLYWDRKQTEQYREQGREVEPIIQGLATCLGKLDPAPTTPDDADFHAQKGVAFIKNGKDARDFEAARKEFQLALNSALWVSDYHYNLALCQKWLKQPEPALLSLRYASILARDDKQRRAINAVRAEIEAVQEIQNRR